MNTQYIRLNMVPAGVLPVMHMSQYDVGRPLGVVVYNGSEVVDMDTYTVTVEATRSDGTPITAAVTTSDNIGAFVTTATMTNKADKYDAQLVLVDSSSQRVASLPFIMRVVEAAMDENAESIEEDASLYQQYTIAVQALIAAIRADLTAEIATRTDADTKIKNVLSCEPQKIFRQFLPVGDYCKIQGGCFINSSTVLYALTAYSMTNNNTELVEVSLSNLSVIRTATLSLSHADDITYNPDTGELYVCPYYDYGQSTSWTDVIIVDYATLTIKSTVTLNVPAYGVAYDRVTQKTYIRDNSLNLYEADLSGGTTTFVMNMAVPNPTYYVKQGITAYNGLISVSLYQPNDIYTFDVNDLSYIAKVSLPYITVDCYIYGEHEFFDRIGDNFVFGSNLLDFTGSYMQCNIWTNMPYRGRQKSYIDEPNICYVDASSTAVCPNGNSSNAFQTLQEASLCSSIYDNGDITFRFRDGTYSGQIRGNKYLHGYGTDNTTVVLNNITVRYGTTRIYQLTLTGTLALGENSSVFESKCVATDCTATGSGTLINYNPFYAINCCNQNLAHARYTTIAPFSNCGRLYAADNYDSIVQLTQNVIDNNESFVIKIYASTSYGGIMNEGFAQLYIDQTMAGRLTGTGLDTSMLFLNGAFTPFYCKIHCIIANGVFSITATGTDTFTIRSVQVGM